MVLQNLLEGNRGGGTCPRARGVQPRLGGSAPTRSVKDITTLKRNGYAAYQGNINKLRR